MGKILYEDKARIETLRKFGFEHLYSPQVVAKKLKIQTTIWIPNNCCKICGKGLEALLSESNL